MGSPFDSDRIFSSSTSGQSKTRGSFTISRPSSFYACYLCLDGDVVFTNYKRDPRFYNLDGTPKYCEEEIKKMMQEEEEERRKMMQEEEEERRKLEEQLAIDKKREEEEKRRRWREWMNSPEGKREEAKSEAQRNLEEFTCKLADGATFCCWAYIIFLSARYVVLEGFFNDEGFDLFIQIFMMSLLLLGLGTALLWKPLQILNSILSTVLYAVAWVVCKEFLIRRNIRKEERREAERQRSRLRNNTRAS
jgi:flagellar biosynthesis GTPase FlhF